VREIIFRDSAVNEGCTLVDPGTLYYDARQFPAGRYGLVPLDDPATEVTEVGWDDVYPDYYGYQSTILHFEVTPGQTVVVMGEHGRRGSRVLRWIDCPMCEGTDVHPDDAHGGCSHEYCGDPRPCPECRGGRVAVWSAARCYLCGIPAEDHLAEGERLLCEDGSEFVWRRGGAV